MGTVELTNMIMIHDTKTNRVVVQDRAKSWKGISLPGGHVEPGESIVDSAVREAMEETGLSICNLKSCGVIHWCNKDNDDRYLVFLFKTTDFSGRLFDQTEEGRVAWMPLEELKQLKSANSFEKYLPMFLEEGHSEAFGLWDDRDPWEIEYK